LLNLVNCIYTEYLLFDQPVSASNVTGWSTARFSGTGLYVQIYMCVCVYVDFSLSFTLR